MPIAFLSPITRMSRFRSYSEENEYWYNKKCEYEEYERECEEYERECEEYESEGERKEREEREEHEREECGEYESEGERKEREEHERKECGEYESEREEYEREEHERKKVLSLQQSITAQDSSITRDNTEGGQLSAKKEKKRTDKIEKEYNRAAIEASYAKKLLKWHKHNLSDALLDGEEKIDTIIDLEEKVKEQEVIFNKCYKEKSDLLELYSKELNTIIEKQQADS